MAAIIWAFSIRSRLESRSPMPPKPQLSNRECVKCAEGNRLMEHIRTEVKRVPQMGVEEFDHVAVFRCQKCGDVKREAFDPADY